MDTLYFYSRVNQFLNSQQGNSRLTLKLIQRPINFMRFYCHTVRHNLHRSSLRIDDEDEPTLGNHKGVIVTQTRRKDDWDGLTNIYPKESSGRGHRDKDTLSCLGNSATRGIHSTQGDSELERLYTFICLCTYTHIFICVCLYMCICTYCMYMYVSRHNRI